MLFDTHGHLDDRAFDCDRDELLRTLPQQSISLLMIPGCNLESSRNVVRLAAMQPYIYAAVGSHPDSADEVNEAVLEEYRTLCAQNPKVKAIGEIGLDYHYEDIPRRLQQQAFEMQVALAQELKKPVIIHDREAHEDTLAILRNFPQVRGVFHCYSGSAEMARQLAGQGWYVGFTGVLTFKNARKAIEAVEILPRERVVIETDCPYMSPEPFRGKRNDPSRVLYVARKLAEIWGVTEEEAQAITLENGKRLYGI